MELSRCLFCSDYCDPLDGGQETPFSLLGRQLKAVFVLRELLRLPPEKLQVFLESSGGDDPHEWITFCDPCGELVEGAFFLFEEQVKIHRKFKKVQQEVVLKVKESQGGGEGIVKETRHFVKNCDYGAFESRFLVGDWEGETRKAVPVREEDVVEKVKEEEDYGDDMEGDLPLESDLSSSEESSTGGRRRKQRLVIREDVDVKEEKEPPLTPKPNVSSRPRKQKGQLLTPLYLQVENHEMIRDKPTGRLKFRCGFPNCDRIYKNQNSLAQHKLLHLEGRLPVLKQWLPCDLCPYSFMGSHGLRTHRKKAHPEHVPRPFRCAKCPLTFVSAETRVQHVQAVHQNILPNPQREGRPRRQCPHCPYTNSSLSSMEAHVTRKHEGRHPFTCEHCGQGVSREAVLRRHQAIQHFICEVRECRAPLENKEQLHAHDLEVHRKEVNVFRCPECGEYLVGQRAAKGHQQLKHPPTGEGGEREQHICELCGKGFKLLRYLKYHIKNTHEGAWKKKKQGDCNQD